MNGYEAQIKKLLFEHGWRFIRAAKGTHEIWAKDGETPQTIPKGCKSRHLANAILKQCHIKQRF
jgi:predicted RNA binding protein YcfA (HicA-like mRNA interferase family)